jgi:alpha/beta hydrolase family protein
VLTYRQVRDAQTDAWFASAAGWRRLATQLSARAETIERIQVRLAADWHGPAGEAAVATLTGLWDALLAARLPLLAADQILAAFASTVQRAQRRLATLAAAPGSRLVTVDEAGGVEVNRGGDKPDDGDLAAAQRTADGIAAVLAEVSAADASAAAGLRLASTGFDGAATPGPPACPPPTGTGPAQVRRWWDSLGAGEQAWLLVHRPDVIGRLDGVPVAARDTANRLVLDRLLLSPVDSSARRGLTALAQRLTRVDDQRAYLLAVDPAGDGRAVVAIGNPDAATNVVTYVPGAGSALSNIDKLLGRTDRLAAAAPGAAAVLWLGYDAPDGVDAGAPGAAHRGAGALDSFEDGLRVTHDGPRGHLTVLGHSYGSLVVGTAAHEHHLDVDDMVFVGSPGVGVDQAGQLGLPAGHVWASTARNDPVQLTGLADRRPEWFDSDPFEDLWYGTNPSRPEFGGRVFHSDPGSWRHPAVAHDAYFDNGSASLDAIAAIVNGDYAAVR